MKMKLLFTMLFLFVTLLVPLSLFSQSQDFVMGTVLVEYRGNAANVTIPSGVTHIGDRAFSWRESLTSVTIPSSVTHIGDGAFSGCSSLTSITIPAGVTSIGDYAFAGCDSLVSVTIPSSVTSIGDSAFFGCPLPSAVREGIIKRFGEGPFLWRP